MGTRREPYVLDLQGALRHRAHGVSVFCFCCGHTRVMPLLVAAYHFGLDATLGDIPMRCRCAQCGRRLAWNAEIVAWAVSALVERRSKGAS